MVHDATRRISFDASRDELPRCPQGMRLARISFQTCPGSDLYLEPVRVETDGVDVHGVPSVVWLRVRCTGLPDRCMRLDRGSHSLRELLRRYGFQDASGCVNHREVVAEYSSARDNAALRNAIVPGVPDGLRDARGVPQFYRNSGVCWYAALCWTTFGNEDVRKLVTSRMPDDLRASCRDCLHSRDAAEHLRKQLWYRYAVGDNVEDPPEMDGRNGFSEFSVLCAKLGVPMIRLREEGGTLQPMDARVTDRRGGRARLKAPRTPDDPHILALRFQDGAHSTKFPMLRRLMYRGRRYRLVGVYAGQRKCGHQIGFCSPTGHWRDWSIGDADLHKDGIGPVFLRFEGDRWEKDWWAAWRQIVHMTKFGAGHRSFCSLSPHNERDDLYEQKKYGYRGAPAFGSNSMDICYVCCEVR